MPAPRRIRGRADRAAAAGRRRRRAGAGAAPDPGLRRRILPHPRRPRPARRQLRGRQHQARQDRRADRGAGAGRSGGGARLQDHGRLHDRHLAGDGAGDAGGAARPVRRSRRAAAAGVRPGAGAALRRQHGLPARAGALGADLRAGGPRGGDRGARRRAGVPRHPGARRRPRFRRRRNGFATLLHIILEQQVSIDAAAAMHRRLAGLCQPLAPEPFLALDDATLAQLRLQPAEDGLRARAGRGGGERQPRFRRARRGRRCEPLWRPWSASRASGGGAPKSI